MAESELEVTLERVVDRVLTKRLDQIKEQIKQEVLKEIKTAFTDELSDLKGEVFCLRNENNTLKSRLEHIERQNIEHEDNKIQTVVNNQYNRKCNIVVFGIKEEKKENSAQKVLNVIKGHLKMEIPEKDIEIAHRLGEIRQGTKRPTIVKFRYRDTKWDVMKSRKLLKGTGVTFSEDLNWEMQQLFREVRTSDLTEACWSWNGKIQAKNKAGKIITIRYGKEWRHLFEEPAASEPQSAEPIEEGTHWKWRLCTLGR